MICSPNSDTNFFDIVAGVLQYTLALYMFIICLDSVLQMSIDLRKENSFTYKKRQIDNISQKQWQT